ncbi:hypothetical protein RND81_08G218400 [Saponaria officinalis]|uniref:Ternary complex factor MIP1 leucine-zipper domain-containing protein n=1 Tax=Saponaria officinalis TaxID=3572 RepID=A0AAW1JB82_SAPOF
MTIKPKSTNQINSVTPTILSNSLPSFIITQLTLSLTCTIIVFITLHFMMKLEEFLMQSCHQKSRRIALEEEVKELQGRLIEEMKLKSVLRFALKGPIVSCNPFIPLLPSKVQTLLGELEMLENEVTWLEANIKKLKIRLCTKKKLNKETNYLMHARNQLHCKHQIQEHKDHMQNALIFPNFMYVKDKMVILNSL